QQIQQGIIPKCFNCSVENTPLWRRDLSGNVICNACGLYFKLHGKQRPVSMKRTVIKRRNRTSVSSSTSTLVDSSPKEPMCDTVPSSAIDGLEILMRAAELTGTPSSSSFTCSSSSSNGAFALESLAEVAAAQLTDNQSGATRELRLSPTPEAEVIQRPTKDDTRASEFKEQLQQECRRLEELLAKSSAILDSL
ncbi:hypothetical protein GGI12_006346, partial [Dipsacomyces acuminosporus]